MSMKKLAAFLMTGLLATSLSYIAPAYADDDAGNGDDQSMQQGSDDGSAANAQSGGQSDSSDNGSADTASGDDDF